VVILNKNTQCVKKKRAFPTFDQTSGRVIHRQPSFSNDMAPLALWITLPEVQKPLADLWQGWQRVLEMSNHYEQLWRKCLFSTPGRPLADPWQVVYITPHERPRNHHSHQRRGPLRGLLPFQHHQASPVRQAMQASWWRGEPALRHHFEPRRQNHLLGVQSAPEVPLQAKLEYRPQA